MLQVVLHSSYDVIKVTGNLTKISGYFVNVMGNLAKVSGYLAE